MNQNSNFTLKSTIEFQFKNSHIRTISYNSFLPDLKKLQTKRSKILIEKKDSNNVVFNVESKDITAFRATINEIISFGRIFEGVLNVVNRAE
ncbi:MAG: hypothetical protein KAW66_08670 [Candidatus Lokiarchaeota archaeon]|nr:hypothetical protein [Candidatus Lokiarchaeota archaeon]